MADARKSPPYFIQLLNAMDGADLTLNERAVLAAQFQFGTHSNGRTSYPSEARLAECLQTSVSTIRRARKGLQDKGWLIERSRGHGGPQTPGKNQGSTFDVVIPPPTVPTPKPKRAPNNPSGRNGRSTGKTEVTGDLKLEVKSSSNPRTPEVTGDHLSGIPLRGSQRPSINVVSSSAAPGGAQNIYDRDGKCIECRLTVGWSHSPDCPYSDSDL